MQLNFLEQRNIFRQQITQRYRISHELYDDMSHLLAPLCAPFVAARGDYLQQQGKAAQAVYWIVEGVTRNGFVTESGTDVTVRFATEGWNANAYEDLLSADNGLPAMQFIMTETEVSGFRIDWQEVCRLKAQHRTANHYYLKVLEHLLTLSARRLYAFSANSAQARLAAFRTDYPGLEQRISQRILASYLGVTQPYLSRMLGRQAET